MINIFLLDYTIQDNTDLSVKINIILPYTFAKMEGDRVAACFIQIRVAEIMRYTTCCGHIGYMGLIAIVVYMCVHLTI
jgi:hypothetical protein